MTETITVKVTRKTREADDIYSFELTRTDGQPLPAFSAGSHIDVHTPGGLVRQYSLCNHPSETNRYLIGVLRDPASRGGSVSMIDQVQEGDTLVISEPRNHFPLTHARHSLLLAGGIGVTPILCMAERLAETGASFEFHYCTRSPSRTAFMERIKSSPFAAQAHFHFDDGADEQKLNAAALLAKPQPDIHLYVCGPTGFMNWVIDTARQQGWAEANIHREYFAAEEVDTSNDESFQVKIASSGQIFTINKDERITDVLGAAGIRIDVSCEEGVCGTCLTRVLEGEIEHRDMFLTDEERAANDQFTPCCSRGKNGSLLILDL
ncbi:MAG: PDR/VanB family oxidoreductase [Spongiibacteraceae bacterium]|nr:PDR/VanB family oxidoreductase [Spongiibacteraceae bacterium]